jgi:predicted Zn-dependent peptidase
MGKTHKAHKTKKQPVHKHSKSHSNKSSHDKIKDETKFRYYQMNCGIKLIMIHNPKSTFMEVSCSVAGGSSEEPYTLSGITHFLEHLVFRKTKHFKTETEMSEFIEKTAMHFNAYTAIKETNYYFSGPSKYENINNSLFVLKEMMFNMELNDHILETERNIVIQEYYRKADNPQQEYYDLIDKNFYAGHPLSKVPIGNIDCLKRITKADIIHYYKNMYNLNNVTLYITGNIPEFNTNKIIGLCEYYFCKRGDRLWTPSIKLSQTYPTINSGKDNHKKLLGTADKSAPHGTFDVTEINTILQMNYKSQKAFLDHNPVNPGLHTIKSAAQLNQNYIGFIFPLNGKYTLNNTLLNAIVGLLRNGKKSKLFRLLREVHGLTYNVHVCTDKNVEGGYLYVFIGVNITDTQKAINILSEFFSKVKSGNFFNAEELIFYKARTIIDYDENKKADRAIWTHLNNIIDNCKIVDIETKKLQVTSIKLQDLNDYAKTILDMTKLYVYVYGSELDKLKL